VEYCKPFQSPKAPPRRPAYAAHQLFM